MKELMRAWKKRAIKYRELETKTNNVVKAESLLAMAETYELCISELKRELLK